MEAEVGVMQPQIREHHGLPEAGKAKEESFPRVWRERGPAHTLISDFWLQVSRTMRE